MAMGAVCTDLAAAGLLHAHGWAVVLLGGGGGRGSPGAELGRLAARLRADGPGRVAVFRGDPADPADLAAALVMAEEQFRLPAVVVATVVDARALIASPPHGA